MNLHLQSLRRATLFFPLLCASVYAGVAHSEFTTGANVQLSTGPAANDFSQNAKISSDGRYVVFESTIPTLVSGDTNGFSDVFIKDLKSSTVSLASVNEQGTIGNSYSRNPVITPVLPSGFYAVAFLTGATNFSDSPFQSNYENIAVHLPTVGKIGVVTSALDLTNRTLTFSTPSITAVTDGTRNKVLVVFSSAADNLVPNDTNTVSDIFLVSFIAPNSKTEEKDPTSTIVRISNGMNGVEANGSSHNPVISENGRFVVFVSSATNLVNGVSGTNEQIYLYDISTGTTTLVSKAKNGTEGDYHSLKPSISYNGRYTAYLSGASNIVSGSTAPGEKTFALRYDAAKDITARVNETAAGVVGDFFSQSVNISPNGRFVVFSDDSSNLDSGDANAEQDVFVKDLELGALARLSVGPANVTGDGSSSNPSISGTIDSELSIVFESGAKNLTASPGPFGSFDVYVTSATFTLPPLTSDTRIETAPVVLLGSRSFRITAEKFSLPAETLSNLQRATPTRAVRYEFEVRRSYRVGRKRINERTTTIQKRNTLSVRKKKGQYSVRNRAMVVNTSTNRPILRTPYSPRQSFSVR